MAVWRAKIGIRDPDLIGDQDYSFNAHVVAANTSAAWARAENIATALLGTILPTTVLVNSIGVANPDVVNGTLIIPQNTFGSRAVTGAKIPAWNVARMQLSPATGERNHTFYLRMGLTEDDIFGQFLAAGATTAVNDLIASLLGIAAMCDKDGFVFTVGGASDQVHMRQLGWRRRHRVGFKRGWVPA